MGLREHLIFSMPTRRSKSNPSQTTRPFQILRKSQRSMISHILLQKL